MNVRAGLLQLLADSSNARTVFCNFQFRIRKPRMHHKNCQPNGRNCPEGTYHLPSLDTPASKEGWARSAGMQNVGEHCSGHGAGLIGTLGRIGGSLNLDRAGGTSSQVPGTIGLLEHVQTVLGTCRPVWGGGGERCLQGGKAQGSWAALPESPGPFGKSRLTPPRGPFRPHGPLSRTSFPHFHRLQSLGTSSNALDAFLVLPGAGRMAPAGWLGEADQTQQGTG